MVMWHQLTNQILPRAAQKVLLSIWLWLGLCPFSVVGSCIHVGEVCQLVLTVSFFLIEVGVVNSKPHPSSAESRVVGGEECDGVRSEGVMPSPKQLLEIRQRKKVHYTFAVSILHVHTGVHTTGLVLCVNPLKDDVLVCICVPSSWWCSSVYRVYRACIECTQQLMVF